LCELIDSYQNRTLAVSRASAPPSATVQQLHTLRGIQMRTNLPVTRTEYQFGREQTLVSVTDLKGRITYCNRAFVEVSGYSSGELLGQPHNLVRHPEMPEEAFRDMWATIQSKLPWTGLVKNRRKNGDYYWVLANATPMLDGETITGYLSVRTVPSAQAVAAAEKLYAQMRQEQSAGRRTVGLKQGQVVHVGLAGQFGRLLQPGVIARLAWVQILLGGLVLAMVAAGLPLPLVALGMILAAALAVFWTWSLTVKPLASLVSDANHLAAGDLSHAVKTGSHGQVGQLQQALNQMSVNLRTVVSDVREEMDQLGMSVQEIADGNQDLSERTESQASNLEETAASMEQIHGNIQQSAESAQRGYLLADDTKDVTHRSNEAVTLVAKSMQEISQSSKKITEIIQLIEGVAFQTNILALNAAVEAARAGDQGRGFAVVATEVRALAQRTTAAAKEIKNLITASNERIDAGNNQTTIALERMNVALSAVDKVAVVLEEISSTSKEQTLGVSQVNEAVTQMDTMTQQNAAMVEELAATAQSLSGQVKEVGNSMRLFRLKSGELTVSQMDAVEMRRGFKDEAVNPSESSVAYLPTRSVARQGLQYQARR
jgi:aerotaxis receptor